jgi:hypothetical protein
VKSIDQAVQRDMLAYIPVCADSSYPSVPSIGKRARNLPALKLREQADKDKSVQALQNMFSTWTGSAEQSAHEQNVSSDVDLEQRISALEVRMENKVKSLIKHAVQDFLQDIHVRLEQERLEFQKLMHLKSHEILSEIKPELEAAVNKAVCAVSTKHSLNTSSPYFNDILTHEPIARRGPRTPRGRPTLPHDSPHVLEDPVQTLPGCTGRPTLDPSELAGEEHVKEDLQDDLTRIMSWLGCNGSGAQALVEESFVGSSGSLDRVQGLGTHARTEHQEVPVVCVCVCVCVCACVCVCVCATVCVCVCVCTRARRYTFFTQM